MIWQNVSFYQEEEVYCLIRPSTAGPADMIYSVNPVSQFSLFQYFFTYFSLMIAEFLLFVLLFIAICVYYALNWHVNRENRDEIMSSFNARAKVRLGNLTMLCSLFFGFIFY